MEHTRFIGLDIHKERISVAVAQSGRSGAVEYLGEIINEPGAISKLCDRLRRSGKPLAFCYLITHKRQPALGANMAWAQSSERHMRDVGSLFRGGICG